MYKLEEEDILERYRKGKFETSTAGWYLCENAGYNPEDALDALTKIDEEEGRELVSGVF